MCSSLPAKRGSTISATFYGDESTEALWRNLCVLTTWLVVGFDGCESAKRIAAPSDFGSDFLKISPAEKPRAAAGEKFGEVSKKPPYSTHGCLLQASKKVHFPSASPAKRISTSVAAAAATARARVSMLS
jgi:hypothetical protein